MRLSFKNIFKSLMITLLLLILCEILSSTFLPFMGFTNFKIPFNVIIVLFLALRIQDDGLPIYILATQLIHSIFSNEGWAVGTIIGIIVSFMVSITKDLIQFSSAFVTIVTVQVFQIIWFLLMSSILCLKMGDFSKFGTIIINFFPESIVLSLMSPLFFNLLSRIWLKGNSIGEKGSSHVW
ncbi:hypothetical protein N9N67_06100 [Bacteriovoracaceae bacterium]|nr:hypothetical protein [Bacteriovoracaceae bacterium]